MDWLNIEKNIYWWVRSNSWEQVESLIVSPEADLSASIYVDEQEFIQSYISEDVFEDSVVNYGDCTRSQLNALGSRLESIVNSTLDK